jgi:hypothetical protein
VIGGHVLPYVWTGAASGVGVGAVQGAVMLSGDGIRKFVGI